MKVSFFGLFLSLVLLGVGTGNHPAQGSSLKVFRGKVSSAAARWLPKVGRHTLTLAIGAMLVAAPLSNADAGKRDWDFDKARRQTNQQLKDEIEQLNVGITVDESGDLAGNKSKIDWDKFEAELDSILDEAVRETNLILNGTSESVVITVDENGDLAGNKSKIDWDKFEAELDGILDEAVRETNLILKGDIWQRNIGVIVDKIGDLSSNKSKIDWDKFEAELDGILDEADRKTNLILKGEIEQLNIGVTVDESGDIVSTETNPFADLLPDSKHKEHLQMLTILTSLETLDAASLFKRGADVSHRVAQLQKMGEEINTYSPELQDHFYKSWKSAVHIELLLDMSLLKNGVSEKLLLAAFPQELDTALPTAAGKQLKRAVTTRHNLLTKLFQGDISKEEYEQKSAGIKVEIATALQKAFRKRSRAATGTSRLPAVRQR